ncbi:MAG: hypothetical protein ACO3QE_03675 [Ilumatobacteraceae bacterium]
MELDGPWRVAPVDDRTRRQAIGPNFDDSNWATADVPGRIEADLGRPIMLRRSLTLSPREGDQRRWVVLEQLSGRADLWLDGAYLGDPIARLTPHALEITQLADLGSEHTLAVELNDDPTAGTISGHRRNWPLTTGLTGPVRLVETGPVRVDRLRVLCRDADDSRAHLLFRLSLDSDRGRQAEVITTVDGEEVDRTTRTLAQGANRVGWGLDLPEPGLWWPRILGDQPLIDIGVEIRVDGEPSDSALRRVGLRHIAWDGPICSVNGERLFIKGANVLPVDIDTDSSADLDPAERSAHLVRRALDIGLEALRVHNHVAHPALYGEADRAGLLILQDIPLPDASLRHARNAVTSRVRDLVDSLGHHPSIASWTPHQVIDGERWRSRPTADSVIEARLRHATRGRRPTPRRALLDLWAGRSLEQVDATRSGARLPGILASLPLLDRAGSHLYLGWNEGDATDLPRLTKRLPTIARFVGEFGFPAINRSTAARLQSDIEECRASLGFDPDTLLERVPPGQSRDLDAWVSAVSQQQADVVRHTVEHLRRLRYRPCGGFTVFSLNDPTPGWGWGLIDFDGTERPGFSALAEACRPVIVIVDRLGAEIAAGSSQTVAVHVVSDLRYDIDEAVVDIEVTGPDLHLTRRFAGAVDADSCSAVGTVTFRTPEEWGTVEIAATVRADGMSAEHHQSVAIQLPLS